MSARMNDVKIYGIFAVPKNSQPEETTEPDTTVVDDFRKGDVNTDGQVSILDVVTLQKYLLGYSGIINLNYNADMNDDNVLNIYDLVLLKKAILNARG